MIYLALFIILFILGVMWFFNRTVKEVVISPVKDGVISQQGFLVKKTAWDVFWASDAINALRLILDAFGIMMLLGWLLG